MKHTTELRKLLTAAILEDLKSLNMACDCLRTAGLMAKLTFRIPPTMQRLSLHPYIYRLSIDDTVLENGNTSYYVRVECSGPNGGGCAELFWGKMPEAKDITEVIAAAWDDAKRKEQKPL